MVDDEKSKLVKHLIPKLQTRVDHQSHYQRASQTTAVLTLPTLASLLIRLNGGESKCGRSISYVLNDRLINYHLLDCRKVIFSSRIDRAQETFQLCET